MNRQDPKLSLLENFGPMLGLFGVGGALGRMLKKISSSLIHGISGRHMLQSPYAKEMSDG